MNRVPFFIGILMVIPVSRSIAFENAVPFQRKRIQRQVPKSSGCLNGYGVGALMYADQAILYEAIKEEMEQETYFLSLSNVWPYK